MKKNTMLMLFVFAIVAIFVIAPIANAEINIKPFKVSGQVREGILFNSNPGIAQRGSYESDWANRVGGTINLELPFGGVHKYTAMYDTNLKTYFNHHSFNSWDNNLVQNADFVFNKWKLNLHQNYVSGETATTISEYAIGGRNRKLLRRNVLGAGAALVGDLGKLELSSGFDYEYYSASKTYNVLDRDTYSAFVDAGWEILPSMDAFVRYELDVLTRRKDSMNDGIGNSITAGIRGDFTEYLMGEAQIGYGQMTFQRTSTAPNVKNFYGLIYSGSLTNRFSKNTTQKVTFKYKPEPGYNEGRAFYRSASVEYNINHRLNKYINVTGDLGYAHNAEGGGPGRKETQKIWTAGTGFNWLLNKWLTIGLEYDFIYRDSNYSWNDYAQHEAILQLIHNF